MKLEGKVVVAQGGGPTAVINQSLAGVVLESRKFLQVSKVYGAINGVEGIVNEDFLDLTQETTNNLEQVAITPSSALFSTRVKPDAQYCKEIFNVLKAHDVRYFFYIGGNDSMDTVHKLSTYAKQIGYPINIIGVPKTIDNDLAVTDHTPGFGSAAKYIATSLREVARDAQVYDSNTVTIVEIMGRNAGWLTAAAALARTGKETSPHLIYLPELPFSVEKFLADVEKVSKTHKNVIAVVSEGIKTQEGKYICEGATADIVDSFGHKQLSGTARVLSDLIHAKFGWKVRSIEFSLLQRCGAHTASQTDLTEAEQIGTAGVKAAVSGETGMMMYFKRVSEDPYKVEIHSADISKIANVERIVPREWINEEGNDILQPAIDYMLPLIQGENEVIYEKGLPVYLKR